MNFIIAFGQCSLAGAYASWYWAWDKKTVNFQKIMQKPSKIEMTH